MALVARRGCGLIGRRQPRLVPAGSGVVEVECGDPSGCGHGSRLGSEFAGHDQEHGRSVVEGVSEFVSVEADVETYVHGPRLVAGDQHLRHLDAIGCQESHPLARPHPKLRNQDIRQPIGAIVQLPPRAFSVPVEQGARVGSALGPSVYVQTRIHVVRPVKAKTGNVRFGSRPSGSNLTSTARPPKDSQSPGDGTTKRLSIDQPSSMSTITST